MKLVNPANKRKYNDHRRRHRPGRRARPRPRWPSSATTSSASATRTARAARTASPPRAASTPPRTTRTTATASTASSTTRSRAATSASREANVYRLAAGVASTSSTSASRRACRSRASTAACSPTARSAARRSRARSTRAARPASSCCSAPTRRSSARSAPATVTMFPRTEMLDLVVVDGQRARHRRARPGHRRDRVARGRRGRPGDRRLRQRLLPLDQRQGLQRHRHLARLQARRRLRQPLLHADPPDLHPGQRRAPVEADADVESLRNDGRVWVPKQKGDTRAARRRSPRTSATTTSSASTRASATWRRATSPRAPPRRCATRAAASAPAAAASTSTSPTPSSGWARTRSRERYGNLFEMYERITGENPYKVPMRIYPAVHYTMGGLWVDYNLMSTIPGLFVLGEANFSDHGANRLGASALMQGLADGYFVIPYTHRRLPRATQAAPRSTTDHADVHEADDATCSARIEQAARRSRASARVDVVPPRAGPASCGTTAAWRATTAGLERGARRRSRELREEFWQNVNVPGARRRAQPGAREGRPRRRLPRVRRAAVPRRARSARSPAAATSARSTRRPTARRKRDDEHFCLRGGLGVHAATASRRCCTRSRSRSRTSTSRTRSYK